MSTSDTLAAGPLSPFRVLDLSRMAPGAVTSMYLGDLGADVIRVEQPGEPPASQTPAGNSSESVPQLLNKIAHGSRGSSLSPRSVAEGRIAAYNPHSRNKRSIGINLKSPEGLRVFLKLVKSADVVIEGFRPGGAQRLGIGYDALRSVNPRLVYCSISGYGQDGPYKSLPGHDVNYIAMTGALDPIGEEGGPPVIPMNFLADFSAGLHAAIGILAALSARDRTGRGQYLELSMTEGVLTLLGTMYFEHFAQGIQPQRGRHRLNGGEPFYAVYRCRDGKYVSIACVEPWFWANLCKAVGRDDLAERQFAAAKDKDEVRRTLSDLFASRTRDEWVELLRGHDVPVAPVNTLEEALSDPQLRARGAFLDVRHPVYGTVRQVGIPVRLSETPGGVRRLSPLLGEHTDDILREVGLSPEEIQRLKGLGALG